MSLSRLVLFSAPRLQRHPKKGNKAAKTHVVSEYERKKILRRERKGCEKQNELSLTCLNAGFHPKKVILCVYLVGLEVFCALNDNSAKSNTEFSKYFY